MSALDDILGVRSKRGALSSKSSTPSGGDVARTGGVSMDVPDVKKGSMGPGEVQLQSQSGSADGVDVSDVKKGSMGPKEVQLQSQSGSADGVDPGVGRSSGSGQMEASISDSQRPFVSIAELYRRLNKDPRLSAEQLDAERKREKREKLFASIGDGLSALSNLYFTSKYAPNMYDGSRTLSERVSGKWDRYRAGRDAQINSYMRGLMAAEQADNENAQRWQKWERQLGIDRYNREKAEADGEYKMARDMEKDRQWRDSFLQKEKHQDQQIELENKKMGISRQKLGEAVRHNVAMESRSSRAGSGSGGGKGAVKSGKMETIKLWRGGVYGYDPKRKGALIGLAPAMISRANAAVERYRKRGDYGNMSRFEKLSQQLQDARSKEALVALIASNICDFPTLDGAVRGVLGIPSTGAKAKVEKRGGVTSKQGVRRVNEASKGAASGLIF